MFTHHLGGCLELWIRCVDFSPDGNILAICSGDNVANLWDLSDLMACLKIGRLRQNEDVDFLDFAPDGQQLAFGGWDDILESTTW